MEQPRLSKSVRRVTILQQDASGGLTPITLYRSNKRKTKKASRLFRPAETAVRRLSEASAAYADTYLDRHRTSNRKRRDGWLRDLNLNVARAARKSTRALKLNRLFGF